MKSVALIIWLLTPNGGEQIVLRDHLDDRAACEAKAREVAGQYAREGRQTRYLCQAVVPENEDVDSDGNPIESR